MLNLHIVQALHGDSLLLEYGEGRQPHFLLIDGGPATTYIDHLRPVLVDAASRGGRLDHVVLTHTDDDHVIGLVDLFAELRGQQLRSQAPLIGVGAMWMNSFAFDAAIAPSMANIVIPLPPPPSAVLAMEPPPASVEEGDLLAPLYGVAEAVDLRELLAQLEVPVNDGFTGGTVMLDASPPQIDLDGLSICVVGPTKSNIDRVRREWQTWLAEHRPPEGVQAIPDLDRKILPDQSIPNRSSIMFVAEYSGKRILFTGDGRGSDVERGLQRRGLLEKDGVYHVDVLKVPHHGSARNNSRKFFSHVTADVYILSANGRDDNPDIVTLGWLAQAVKEQGRQVRIVATNMAPSLAEMRSEFPPAFYGYTLEVLDAGQHAFTLAL